MTNMFGFVAVVANRGARHDRERRDEGKAPDNTKNASQ
jgi:hypothetical protein